jgi:hypothetical protein
MQREIIIWFGNIVIQGVLNESHTATLIWEALPLEGEVNLWGEEIYFTIPVESELDAAAKDVVEKGDIGYWPTGQAMCIFFGPTPMSQGDEIRPASPVNIVGEVKGDLRLLKKVTRRSKVRLERPEEQWE